MTSLLASAEAVSIGVRTQAGRILEYRTSVVGQGESEQSFSIYVPPDLWDRLTPGLVVLVKASLPGSFLLFDAKVVSLDTSPVALAHLAAVERGRVRRIQRRQHFRVSAVLPVTFTFERPDAKVPERVAVLTAKTFDVSGGGVGVLVDRSREPVVPAVHTRGQLELSIGPLEPRAERAERSLGSPIVVACGGRIARIEEVANGPILRLGVDFQNISEPQRLEVSRFVISHQLALRRRGVLR